MEGGNLSEKELAFLYRIKHDEELLKLLAVIIVWGLGFFGLLFLFSQAPNIRDNWKITSSFLSPGIFEFVVVMVWSGLMGILTYFQGRRSRHYYQEMLKYETPK